MKTIIFNGKIITGDSIIQKGYVGIENGVITEIGAGGSTKKSQIYNTNSGIQWIDAEGGYVSPGFIDLHVHGVGICDIYHDTPFGLGNMAKVLAAQGVTAFLATLISQSKEETINTISRIRKQIEKNDIKGAHILGINIEGPFINPDKSGAQSLDAVRRPDLKELKKIIKEAKGILKIMTIAPEISGSLELAKQLKDNGIIPSIGHTKASFEEAMNAIDRGITYISHTFNAMTPFHHREPGAVGAIFMRKEVVTEIIADGVHVHPAVIKFLCQIKDHEKIILVTDALTGIMRRGDKGSFAGREVISDSCVAKSGDGLLMGSVTPMNRALQNIVQYTDLDLVEAVKLATVNPARIMGLENRKGRLEIGKDADIIILGQDFYVNTTLVGGKII